MPDATPRKRKGPPVDKGDAVELAVESLAYGGKGIARIDNYVVFVGGAAPGERVRASITKRKASHAEAELLEVLDRSPQRVDPPCDVFGRCGGCSWQHLSIEGQLEAKQRIVRDALRPLAGRIDLDAVLEPIVPSPRPYHYRNKMEFTFGREGNDPEGAITLGFHYPGDWKRILDVRKCWLQPEPLTALLDACRAEGARQRLSVWSPREHKGTLRQLLLRWSEHEQRAVVALLTADEEIDFEAFRQAVCAACPQAKAIVWGINSGRSDVARPERIVAEWGEPKLVERIGACEFEVSLTSFFQTNSLGAELLYETAREYLSLTGLENLVDAYCGAGTIGIFCAKDARAVYGVEIVADAVRDARRNAARNGLRNCTFVAGDMGEVLGRALGAVEGPVDRLVVDPPRSGMDKRALAQLIAIRAPVMAYVSCNPTTMARDLEQILDDGYRVDRLRAVDMFPQTYHIECVARCVRDG